jgi:hypothetical protein
LPEQGKPRAGPLGLKTVPRNAPRNACIRLVIEVLSAPDSAQIARHKTPKGLPIRSQLLVSRLVVEDTHERGSK